MKKITFLLCFSIILGSTHISQSASQTPMPYGGVVVINNDTCTETDYPSLADTDTARGDQLLNAVSDIKNGGEFNLGLSNQTIYLTAGTFDIGANKIDLAEGGIKGVLSGNNIHGAGVGNTIIRSSIHGPNSQTEVTPSMNSQITDLTITANSFSDYEFPLGLGQGNGYADFGNIFLKNIDIGGSSDGIYFNGSIASDFNLNIIDSSVRTSWDAIAIIGGNSMTINVYNSTFNVSGNSSLTTTNFHGINDMVGIPMNIYNSTFTTNGKNDVYGLYSRGIVNIYGGNFNTTSDQPSRAFDLYAYSSGSIKVSPSTNYDVTKKFGNVSTTTEHSATPPSIPAEVCTNPLKTIPTTTLGILGSVTTNSANINAKLFSNGYDPITTYGVNYGTTTSYGLSTSTNSVINSGRSFSQNISGLVCGTTYHYQAYTTNSIGTGTSTDQIFTTSDCPVVITPPQTSPAPVFSSFRSGGYISSSELAKLLAPASELFKFQTNASNTASTSTTSSIATSTTLNNKIIFSRDLSIGSEGDDVKSLQKYLNSNGFIIATKGAGSIGNETNYFGSATKKSLIKFQIKNNINPAIGYFGKKSRDFISKNI